MNDNETAIFAGGCFWCTEALFENVKGVLEVTSGYATNEDESKPTYETVSSGTTNFAEAIKITFDPKTISYKELVFIFLRTHDPTTLNRQGADRGTQYRSAIFYTNDKEQKIATEELKKANQEIYNGKVVTELVPLKSFFVAEDYHQGYYDQNREKPYCQVVINPKLAKFKKEFSNYLKEHN